MTDPNHYTPHMAANPALPQADMQQIAASRPDLLPALATNPALYPELRAWLENHPNPAVRSALGGAVENAHTVRAAPIRTGMADLEAATATAAAPASPLSELLDSAPREAPSLNAPFSHISALNQQPPAKKSAGRTIAIVLLVLLVLAAAVFGVSWLVFRDDGADSSGETTTPAAAEPTGYAGNTPASSPTVANVVKPAPADALDISGFASPTGNLQCQFTQNAAGQDMVKCTMWEYEFVPDISCTESGAPLTYELFAQGEVRKRCTYTDTVGNMPEADYETSMAQNGFACTLEQYNGFTCWSEESGEGFQIRKRWDRSF